MAYETSIPTRLDAGPLKRGCARSLRLEAEGVGSLTRGRRFSHLGSKAGIVAALTPHLLHPTHRCPFMNIHTTTLTHLSII